MFPHGEPTTSQFIIIFIVSIIFAFICAYYSEKKGRNAIAWFILGFLFTFYALIVLFFLSPIKKEEPPTMIALPPDPALKDMEPSLSSFEKSKEENRLWYYLDANHAQIGPVSLIGLQDLWDRGLLEINNFVWSEGMEKWEKIEDLPDLKKALSKYVE
jgi:hypothetical protein